MRVHYLFGNRYEVGETKAMHDLRHRNGVYGVSERVREAGFSLEFHYCTQDKDQQLDITGSDIVINLHPQLSSTHAHFLDAKVEGAVCGVFLDSSDTAAIFDTALPLNAVLRQADFVLVPTMHHANLIAHINKHAWVIPPIVETESRLPLLDLDDVKKNERPLRISCVLETENYQSFIRLLPDVIRFSHDILPVEMTLVSREPTGFTSPISRETVVATAQGLAQILTKNSQSLTIAEKELTPATLNETLHRSDCLFVLPSDETIEGNIQIPLMGIHTGNFVFIPEKQKVYDTLLSYGVIPYRADCLLDTLQKTLTVPHEVLRGSMADGRKAVKQHYSANRAADLLIQAWRSEYKRKKSGAERPPMAGRAYDWNALMTKLGRAATENKESQSA